MRGSDRGRAYREEGQALPGPVFGGDWSTPVFVPQLPAWYDIDRCSTPGLCSRQEINPVRRYCVPPHALGAIAGLGCRSEGDQSANFWLDSSGLSPRGRHGGT